MIDGKATEDVSGQICAQYGLMDHIDLGRSTLVRKREEGCLCFFVFHTTLLVFGVAEKSHQTELLRHLNTYYLGDTKYHF